MESCKKYSIFLHLMTIIAIVYLNISPIICYHDITNKDSNEFEQDEQHQQHYQQKHHHPITFSYGNSEKYPWRQKSYNNIENEQLPSIVGLQESNQGYNSWEKQNHYKNENDDDIHNFNAIQYINNKDKINNIDDDIESNEIYGIDTEKRSGGSNGRQHVHQAMDHHHLCETITDTVPLKSTKYIYRPDFYIKKECKYPTSSTETGRKNKICSKHGYECVTKNSTIYLTRKSIHDNCWETVTHTVHTGCECMWPEYPLGDIKSFY